MLYLTLVKSDPIKVHLLILNHFPISFSLFFVSHAIPTCTISDKNHSRQELRGQVDKYLSQLCHLPTKITACHNVITFFRPPQPTSHHQPLSKRHPTSSSSSNEGSTRMPASHETLVTEARMSNVTSPVTVKGREQSTVQYPFVAK